MVRYESVRDEVKYEIATRSLHIELMKEKRLGRVRVNSSRRGSLKKAKQLSEWDVANHSSHSAVAAMCRARKLRVFRLCHGARIAAQNHITAQAQRKHRYRAIRVAVDGRKLALLWLSMAIDAVQLPKA